MIRCYRSGFVGAALLALVSVSAVTPIAWAAFPPPIIVGVGPDEEVDPPIIITPPPVNAVPEPGTMALATMGIGAVTVWKKRRDHAAA